MSGPAYRYRAIVRRVVDGDTIDCDVDLGFRAWRMGERFRLLGVDAPEVRGPERPDGLRAADWLRERLPDGAEIVVETQPDPDAFGRWLARVLRDGVDLCAAIIEAGHAKPWSKR